VFLLIESVECGADGVDCVGLGFCEGVVVGEVGDHLLELICGDGGGELAVGEELGPSGEDEAELDVLGSMFPCVVCELDAEGVF